MTHNCTLIEGEVINTNPYTSYTLQIYILATTYKYIQILTTFSLLPLVLDGCFRINSLRRSSTDGLVATPLTFRKHRKQRLANSLVQ